MGCYNLMLRIEDITKWETAKDGHKYHPAKIMATKDWEKDRKKFIGQKWGKPQLIPCGNCIGCRLDYSRDWANRGYLESLTHGKDKTWFVTLTYDEYHITIPEEITTKKGITFCKNDIEKMQNINQMDLVEWQGTLIPKDLQQFMKNLRQIMKRELNHDGIRFMACGEYGGETKRPHYHLILFNCPLPTKSFYNPKITNLKDIHYQNEIIERAWGGSQKDYDTKNSYFNPKCKGICDITEATWNTIAYVGRYVTKKIKGEESDIHYGLLGQEKEFFRASNRPAIGYDYYMDHKEQIYKKDQIKIKTRNKVIYVKPPKYFDKLYKEENPEDFERIRKKREKDMLNSLELKTLNTSLKEFEQAKVEERTKISKAKSLPRQL